MNSSASPNASLPHAGRLFVLFVALMLLVQVGPAFGQSSDTPAAGDSVSVTGLQTAEEIAACLQQRPNLAVALLIDETGSLVQTDPANERAPVLAGFLSRLEDIAGTEFGDRTRQVLVSIAYFGTGVDDFLPWSPIDAQLPDPARGENATRSIAQTVLEVTPGRNRDLTTEFSDAIDWATARHREVDQLIDPATLCTLTLWFSDGELDPDNQPRASYERPAVIEETARLCEPDGVLDEHRRSGAALVGILLLEQLTESSMVTSLPRMHAMVEGVDPGGRECGTEPARGLYLEGDLDLLSLQFERAIAPGQGGSLQGTYRGDPVTFTVDPGVARVRVVMSAREGFALTTANGATVEVSSPSAAPSVSGLARDVRPDIRWASGAVSIDLAVAGATGEWTVRREASSGPIDVYYFTDLGIRVDLEETRLRSGENGTFEGRVVDGIGDVVDLEVYPSRELSVTVDGVAATVDLRSDGTFTARFPVNTEEARIAARLRLDLTTVGGTVLQSVTREVQLPVVLPGWFPEVRIEREFDRDLTPGGDDATLAITALGSDLGPTRICVRAGTPGDGSEQLAQLIALGWSGTDLSRCIDLDSGERFDATLVATLEAAEVRERSVGFPLEITLVSAEVDGRPSVSVDYEERRSIVVQPAAPNPFIVLLLLLLGLLIPLIILDLLNRRAARFRTRNLRHAHVPVSIDRSAGSWRVSRSGGGSLLTDADLEYLPSTDLNGQREWKVRPHHRATGALTGETWEASAPRWPLGTVRALVKAGLQQRVVSNEVPTTKPDGRSAGIGLNPQRSAYLLIADSELRRVANDGDGSIPATLVTVLGHEGHDMGAVIRDHAEDLATSMTGGEEIDKVIEAVRTADQEEAAASAASDTEASTAKAAAGVVAGAEADDWLAGTTDISGSPWPDPSSGSGPPRPGDGGGGIPGWD